MELSGRHEDLIKIIDFIKNDKIGMTSYKNIDSYYQLMYKYLPSKNIVEFINNLVHIPVKEYIDDIEDDSTLLNTDGSLRETWDNWHIAMTSQGQLDDVRFEKFRENCFKLSESDMPAAEELYRLTRTYIIQNPIINKAEDIQYIFADSIIKIPYAYRKIAMDYIRDSYDILKLSTNLRVCNTCGYIKNFNGKIILHRLCNPVFSDKTFAQGTLVLKPEVFYAITNPGRFEYEVFKALLYQGFYSVIFPEVEKSGDIFVSIGGDGLYLDMKAYNYPEALYNELVSPNGFLKEKYRNRWIIVPDLYYSEQFETIGDIIRSGGSRLYNIDGLINKLHRLVEEGK